MVIVFASVVIVPAVVVSILMVIIVSIGLFVMLDVLPEGFKELSSGLVMFAGVLVLFGRPVLMLLLTELLRLDVLCGRGGSSKLSKSRSLYSSSVMLVAQDGIG